MKILNQLDKNSPSNIIIFFIIISLMIRSILLIKTYQNPDILYIGDQSEYLNFLNIFNNGLSYGLDFGTKRMPIYPSFIYFLSNLSENPLFVSLVQHLIGLSSIIIAYKIGKLFSDQVALLSSFFSCINFNFIIYGNFILTESIFIPIILLVFYFFLKFIIERKSIYIIFLGLSLGIACLIKTITIYFPILIVFIILVLIKEKLKFKIKNIFVFLIAFYLISGPWLLRNHYYYQHFSFTSHNTTNLIGWYLPHIDQYEKKLSINEARKKRSEKWVNYKKKLSSDIIKNPFKLDIEAKKYAFKEILDYNLSSIIKAFFWGGMKNIFSPIFIDIGTFFQIPHSSFYETSGISFPKQAYNFIYNNTNKVYSLTLLVTIMILVLFRVLQLYALITIFKKNKILAVSMILFILYFLILSGPIGYAKYRIPFEGVFVLLTAIGFQNIVNKFNKNK